MSSVAALIHTLFLYRMIEKRAFDKEPSKHLISLEYNLTPDNSTNSKTITTRLTFILRRISHMQLLPQSMGFKCL